MFEIYGDFGVRVFFVISGYLITGLLLKEHEKTGSISLRNFYLRRAYRILPAAYVYMLIVITIHGHRLSWASIVAAVTYTSNYLRDEPWALGHLWSLSVEEQFYLLWPLTLAVFFRKKLWVVAGLLLSAPPLRVLFWAIWGYHGLAHFFPVLMDALGAGCALAMLQPQRQRWDRCLRSRWFLLVPALTVLLPLLRFVSNRSYQVAGLSVMHLGIALSILHAVQMQYRVLNWEPAAWMGTLSYSFYLWQQPFLNRTSREWWTAFPQNLLLAGLFGAASYYCVEKPFLTLRERWKEQSRVDQTVTGRKTVRRQEVPGTVSRIA